MEWPSVRASSHASGGLPSRPTLLAGEAAGRLRTAGIGSSCNGPPAGRGSTKL